MTLHLVPVRFADASGFVEMWHRHHSAPVGCKYCIGCADEDGVLHGVAIVGRPVSRMFDNGRHRKQPRSCACRPEPPRTRHGLSTATTPG